MEVQKAEDVIKQVIASQEFKDRIMNYDFGNIKYTNEEIYQKILEGAETDNEIKDNVMELVIEVIPQKTTSRIYKIMAGIKKIFFFLNLFHKATPASIAENLFFHWLGKIGLDQTINSTSQLTVQDAISKIIGELGKKYI